MPQSAGVAPPTQRVSSLAALLAASAEQPPPAAVEEVNGGAATAPLERSLSAQLQRLYTAWEQGQVIFDNL